MALTRDGILKICSSGSKERAVLFMLSTQSEEPFCLGVERGSVYEGDPRSDSLRDFSIRIGLSLMSLSFLTLDFRSRQWEHLWEM